ncbi:hypothetical protein AVEN_166426-1 [Araneus ventricosus]|uniref:THAP-type domain-containing protein n=1 Tax=Araneus ventricosus TaxID=182803 RepID=A0A4Y2EXP8_ARAVE|nr:hypothetical protein AVEN_166426-1 [Araneus ventricosus]
MLKRKLIAEIKRFCSSLICSDHFEENSYSTCQFTKRRLLKQEVVPIIFSKTPKQTPKVGLPSSATDGNNMQPDGTKHGMHSVSSQTETFTDVSDRMTKLKDELKELQDSLGKKAFIPENISNDTQMKALTSFTKERFSCVYSFLNVEEDLQTGNFCKRLVDIFFLFLVKLRTGISNEFLSVLLEISDSTVSRYFTFVMTVLYEKLKLLHIFPSKSKVVESIPRQFYSENRDCRVIVDCTEFPIQKPNSPAEQQMTFSFYKNTNTLKDSGQTGSRSKSGVHEGNSSYGYCDIGDTFGPILPHFFRGSPCTASSRPVPEKENIPDDSSNLLK